jgi:glycosyltransferase involved in cell wall biosynthesis
MKALLASYSDTGGGAARAAVRTLEGICTILPDTRMIVSEQLGSERRNIIPAQPWSRNRFVTGALRKINRLPLLRHGPIAGMWSADFLASGVAARIASEHPDVVNLHWVQHACILPKELTHINCPIVWTLHDLAPLTGGCHYPGNCTGWRSGCGNCPMLQRRGPKDASCRGIAEKDTIYPTLNLTFVAPSRWMADLARTSPLTAGHTIEHIPNGLNQELFRPTAKIEARQLLGLPTEGRIILFGADRAMRDRRKGFHLLKAALPRLTDSTGVRLVVFGANRIDNADDFPFPIHALGVLKDDAKLALAYSAADLLVVPSLEDNLPNTIVEALSCGCPCVGFDVGGIPEMIEEGQTGALATAGDPHALAMAVLRVLHHPEPDRQRAQARKFACATYDLSTCGRRYQEVFASAIAQSRAKTNGHLR